LRVRAHFFAGNQTTRGHLDGRAAVGRDAPLVSRPLPDQLRLTVDGYSNGGLTAWRLVYVFGKVHGAAILSEALYYCQARRLLQVFIGTNGIGR
jgi:hypothetical protein